MIFENEDIVFLINEKLDKVSKLNFHRICKTFNKFKLSCDICLKELILPIIRDKNYCNICSRKFVLKNYKFLVYRNDLILWKEYDKITGSLKCNKCNLKNFDSESFHYHINFLCRGRNNIIQYNKLLI